MMKNIPNSKKENNDQIIIKPDKEKDSKLNNGWETKRNLIYSNIL